MVLHKTYCKVVKLYHYLFMAPKKVPPTLLFAVY